MSSFFADPAVGGDGSTTTDDANATTGLDNWGFKTRLIPMFTNIIAVANYIKNLVTTVQSLATTILNSAGTICTSVTTFTPATGSKTFVTQSGKSIAVGQFMIWSDATAANWMFGQVTGYSGTNLTMNITTATGSTSTSAWTGSLAAASGVSSARQVLAAGLATGGGDMSADRTITVTAATKVQIKAGTDTQNAVTSKGLTDAIGIDALTDAGPVTWNMATQGPNVKIVYGGNRVMAVPTNPKEGMTYTCMATQDATGSRVPDWTTNTCFDWGGKGPPTFSTGANKMDLVTLYCYDAATPKFRCFMDKSA